ncbi:MAG: hypothetical protein AAFN93_05635 [Bacteroidota bacterium]
MRSVLAILILWLTTNTFAQSQDTTNHKVRYLSLSGGTGHVSLNNLTLTPLVYRGSGFVWDLQISNHSVKRKHDINLNYSTSTLFAKLNDNGGNPLDNKALFFSYEYQRNLKAGSFNWYLGGGFDYFNSERILSIVNRSSSSRNEFFSVRLVTSVHKTFKQKHRVEWNFSYTIGSVIIGLTNIPNGLEEGSHKFFSGIETIGLTSTLNYKFKLSDRLLLDATYRFRYYRNTDIEEFDYGTSQYLAGISYQFSK